MRDRGEGLPHKRAMLRSLGEEIARLHRSGFVHGHLTPYIVIVEGGEPPRFVFIDNERTRRATIGRMRSRLPNLVQLGRFEPPGLTRADHVRVLRAYEDALVAHHPRRLMRRAASMLARRLERGRVGAKNVRPVENLVPEACRNSPMSSPVASERRAESAYLHALIDRLLARFRANL